jgi:hypothetical protein
VRKPTPMEPVRAVMTAVRRGETGG